MTMKDFIMDAEAQAFARFAESNPRLKELAGKDCYNNLSEAEQDELFELFEQADAEFFADDDDPIWDEDPVDLFGPWWE